MLMTFGFSTVLAWPLVVLEAVVPGEVRERTSLWLRLCSARRLVGLLRLPSCGGKGHSSGRIRCRSRA
jgi:hypothetical protein